MRGAVYRICSRCGQRWNVSVVEPGGKMYRCPRCDGRRGAERAIEGNAPPWFPPIRGKEPQLKRASEGSAEV